jgi:hypothetical protein
VSEDNGVGRTLEPTKMRINKFRRSDVTRTSESSTPDQFGQAYNNDYDRSKWSGEGPQQTRRNHDRADTDLSARALHHTLGTGHNQASPGDHDHAGINSKKIGPLEIDPTGTNKTRPEWTIPLAPTVGDLVTLLGKFVNFRQV